MDLLAAIPGHSNSNFEVQFDMYTPRAHLVILPFDKNLKNYNMLSETRKQEVLSIADILVDKYHLGKTAIFSLHSGSWVSKKSIFHAHICVDVDDYISLFEARRSQMGNLSSFVTGQWQSKNPEDYLVNVKNYPSKSYWKDEVKQVQDILFSASQGQLDGILTSYNKFNLKFHPSQPHIGFVSLDRVNNLTVLEIMNQFAFDHGMARGSGASDENAGCHICIPLDGKSHGFQDGIQGYIRVSGVKFIQLCPKEIRQEWFRRFSSKDVPAYT